MKLQIIQVEPDEDVNSIRDRLSLVSTDRVLLVLPKRNTKNVIPRKLDLVLIQREAARHGALLALVTNARSVIDFAQELNISTFGSTRAAQTLLDWKSPRNKVFVERADRPESAPVATELRPIASRLRELSPRERLTRRLWRFGALAVLVITLLIAGIVLLPTAQVTLTTAKQQIETDVQITADASITVQDVEKRLIPAVIQQLDVEATASIPATGLVDVPSTLASGLVLFTNRTNQDVTIPAGTVVFSTGISPARFRVIDTLIVPGGSGNTSTATIQALDDTPGPKGNIEPNLIINIEGPLGDFVYVRNPDYTRGGSVRQQGVITKADYDNLLIVARQELRRVAKAQFESRLSGGQLVAADTIKLVDGAQEELTYSAFVGDQEDSLTLNIRAKMSALIVDQQPARAVALASLSAKVPAGRELALETITYRFGDIRPVDTNGRVMVVVFAAGDVAAQVDPERVRQRIAGLSIEQAMDRLNRDWLLDPLHPPLFAITPSAFGRLPLLSVRIDVKVE